MNLSVGSTPVFGIDVDGQTRCAHYNSELDIIAIRFKCCSKWFPCFECHREVADHEAEAWRLDERDQTAILCGACGHQMTIDEYLGCDSTCPECQSKFNPACRNHHHLYFE